MTLIKHGSVAKENIRRRKGCLCRGSSPIKRRVEGCFCPRLCKGVVQELSLPR